MAKIVTADEFILGVISQLALQGVKELTLRNTANDARFEKAFAYLRARAAQLGVEPDFSLVTNPYHGDSGILRETLYAARERGVVALNNPRLVTVAITLSDDDARHQLSRASLPHEFFKEVVDLFFEPGLGNGRSKQVEAASG